MRKILVVEDETAIREMIALFLSQHNYEVIEAGNFQDAVQKLNQKPQIILLDWMLPGKSGIQFIQHLKKQETTEKLPIIMLTARSSEEDCIQGLSTGADDYLTKPFSPKILLARLEALWRRSYNENPNLIQFDNLILDVDAKRFSCQHQEIPLSGTEFKLLQFFITHPEKVYSRDQLLDFVWGNDIYVEDRTVDSYIRRLRKSLEPFGLEPYIQTIRGMGYRFSNHFQD